MRLDVALVNGGGLVFSLDHHIGLGKAGSDVALHEFEPLGDVGRLVRRRREAVGPQVIVKDRRAVLHRIVNIDHVRQDFVVDLDQRKRLGGDLRGGRGHRGDGMAVIERFLACHHVARHVAQVRLHLAGGHDLVGLLGEVLGGDDRLDPMQGLGLRRVNRLDPSVRVRAAEDLADELARHVEVGAEPRTARHLVGAVRAVGASSDPLVVLAAHRVAPLNSAATSMTARMILS